MSRYRSCRKCPAYNYAFLSDEQGKCALKFKFFENDEKTLPLEECTKPKNITELHIFAKNLGIELPGGEALMDEKDYNFHCLLRKVAKSLIDDLKEYNDIVRI